MVSRAEAKFLELIRLNPIVDQILERLGDLSAPDAWLVSGCLFQTVWNVVSDQHPARAIKDYDVFYFDGTDLSASTEESLNQQAAALIADLECEIDVRNQARVHLWYEREFGVGGYPELTRSTDGIDNFLAVCCMVGVRRSEPRGFELYAPFGVGDVLELIMRPNPWFPNAPRHCYERKAQRWSTLWPRLRVVPFDGQHWEESVESIR